MSADRADVTKSGADDGRKQQGCDSRPPTEKQRAKTDYAPGNRQSDCECVDFLLLFLVPICGTRSDPFETVSVEHD